MATNVQLNHMLTIDSEPGPFVSLFVPDSMINHPEFNRLVVNAKHELKRHYPKQAWKPYQNKLIHLRFPHLKNREPSKGVAIYIGPHTLRIFRLNYGVTPHGLVNDTMWILPLLMDKLQKVALHHHPVLRQFSRIIKLAPAGLIDVLIINSAAVQKYGRLLNDLAITVLGFGGRVSVVPGTKMQNHDLIRALRRK